MSSEEILDIVDINNCVIGKAPRAEIYRNKLMHRIVHVHLFNSSGEIGLQLRSATCSFCPLHWSTSVGGHVQAGESAEQAAYREYKEELGATSPLSFMSEDLYEADSLRKFLISFKTVAPNTFCLDSTAVKDFRFFSLSEISSMITRGEKFHPELLFLLRAHFT